MELQFKYDELENIIDSINILIDDITDVDYIEQLNLIKYQAETEKEQIECQLQKQQWQEQKQMEQDYIKEQL